ncbi:MAG: cobalt ECF transporter T component CbiQ [Peptococcaceae bacterium]|nr:cobalt ECF transporter T component CbiQ [Peptococcaceae bacterium]
MLSIDRYAYSNKLRHVHPAEKCGFALITVAVCLASSNRLTFILVILLMAGLAVFRAGIPLPFYLKLMCVPMSFLAVGVLTVAISITGENHPFLWGLKIGGYTLGVTGPGLQAAADLFLKSLGAVSCLYFLSLTTPVVEILAVIKKLRLPPLFIELMSLVYRFIFVLLETAQKIQVAQSSRWGYASLKTSFHSLGQLGANLFVKSYHHSQMIHAALSARCYSGDLNVLEEPRPLSKRNLGMIAAADLVLLAVGIWPGK